MSDTKKRPLVSNTKEPSTDIDSLPDSNHQINNVAAGLARVKAFQRLQTTAGEPSVISHLDDEPEPEEVKRKPFQCEKIGNLAITPPEWVIKGILEKDCLIGLFAPPASYKSFLAIFWAAYVAAGKQWNGYKVKQGSVLYIAGEGKNGILRRLRALSIANNINLDELSLYLSNMAAALTEPKSLQAVANELVRIGEIDSPPVLIVIDTLNRNSGASDENSTQDMTAFMAAADILRSFFGSSIIIVHHTGHSNTDRARGSSVFRASLDAEIRMIKNQDDTAVIDFTKMKDGEIPDPLVFKLATVELGLFDDDGIELTSAVLVPVKEGTTPKKRRGKWQSIGLDLLKEMIQKYRINLDTAGYDPEGARVSVEDWREVCQEAGMNRQRFYEVKKVLSSNGEINIKSGYLTLSGSCVTSGSLNRETGQDVTQNSTQNVQTVTKPDTKRDMAVTGLF